MGHKGKGIKVVFSSLKHIQDQITKICKCDGCNKFCVDFSLRAGSSVTKPFNGRACSQAMLI